MLPSPTGGDVMLRFTLFTCLIAFAATSQVFAQQSAEIGTLLSLSHLRASSYWGETETNTIIGVPSVLSIWLIPSEYVAIGSEISFASVDTDFFSLLLGGQAAFFPISNQHSGIYALGTGSLATVRNFGSTDTDIIAGIGMGLRARIGSALVLRTEGRYERWFEQKVNQFSLLFGLGTRLGG